MNRTKLPRRRARPAHERISAFQAAKNFNARRTARFKAMSLRRQRLAVTNAGLLGLAIGAVIDALT
jgi:hypothetical protein